MAQDRHGIYPSQFVHGGGTLTLSQLESVEVDSAVSLRELIASGNVDRDAVVASHAEPIVRLSTCDLAGLLATLSLTTGLACTGGATIQYQKRAEQGLFASGSNHYKLASTLGFLMCDAIRATQDDAAGAMADCVYVPLYDGSAVPLVASTGVALSGSPAFGSQFYLGAVYYGGAQLEGVQSVVVRPGLVFSMKRADGDPYARKGAIVRRLPTFAITFDKLTSMTSGPNSLVNSSASSSLAIYFRKGVHGGVRVADGSTVHVKISSSAGAWRGSGFRVAGEDDATVTLMAEPTGTIALSAASAIP